MAAHALKLSLGFLFGISNVLCNTPFPKM